MPPRRSCFGPAGPGCGRGLAVSMPPRRSCFPDVVVTTKVEDGVSMPPRRSCFGPVEDGQPQQEQVSMPPRRSCFIENFRDPELEIAVSMPPRRSCFSGRGGLGRSGNSPFQCHHGVPASRRSSWPAVWLKAVSMPPRRSCFVALLRSGGREGIRFNATTAFLLPGPLR